MPGVLSAIWGRGPRDIYVSGDGSSLHYDGDRWSPTAALFRRTRLTFSNGPAAGLIVAGPGGAILRQEP